MSHDVFFYHRCTACLLTPGPSRTATCIHPSRLMVLKVVVVSPSRSSFTSALSRFCDTAVFRVHCIPVYRSAPAVYAQPFAKGRGSVKLNVLLDSQTFIGTGK